MEGGSWEFVLGTDAVGRDILSRLIHGARYSLYVGAIAITIAFSAGVTLGLIAGFFRGTVEILIARSMDIILAFPSILLAVREISCLVQGEDRQAFLPASLRLSQRMDSLYQHHRPPGRGSCALL